MTQVKHPVRVSFDETIWKLDKPLFCLLFPDDYGLFSYEPTETYSSTAGRGMQHGFRNPGPISDQNIRFSVPGFRPDLSGARTLTLLHNLRSYWVLQLLFPLKLGNYTIF